MFINLSNHPSTNWSDSQREATIIYGSIIDIPFPNIPPQASSDDILTLAQNYAQQVLKDIPESGPSAIHVMGEISFCQCFVGLIHQQSKIPCLVSTTERQVSFVGNTKQITFDFVQFRAYPRLN